MTPRRQRMIFVAVVLGGVSAAVLLVVLAIGENMLYFFSPSQIRAGEAPTGQTLRVGGLVVEGSVARGEGLAIRFDLTDGAEAVSVAYEGILPDLFRVLAKHDENYMPPEVAEAIKLAEEGGTIPNPHADR